MHALSTSSFVVPAAHRARAVRPRGAARAHATPMGLSDGSIAREARSARGVALAARNARAHRAVIKTHETARASVVTYASSGAATAPGGSDASASGASLGSRIRAIAFFATSFTLAIPLICIMVLIFPFCWVFDRTRRSALSFVNDVWATVSTSLFFPVKVSGRENLPPANKAAVYVANHASFMDIYSMFHLRRPFKFISKTSNFLIPVVGWSMFLTGHVPLKRMERRSQMETLKKCRDMLADGGSVLFFPEGTRSVDGTMAPFKKGAFSVAAKENVPVIPVTIVGAHEAMASGKEYALNNGGIKVIVHPAIQSTDADELCAQAEKIIKESLVNES